ncbi:MAG: hypothetical protein O7G13_11695 [Alphaproteobacteria bacterium]|nr:hypothetical protein [Alphaproteobacteria bacterium]MCZ6839925.1 hypothetical protein [Alphaproteobacteria bacterium]
MDYTLANLTEFTGAKRRTVQVWAEGGVIQAEASTSRAGTGVHRRFSRDEAIIACLVHAFARRLQSPIGVLLRISALVRESLGGKKFRTMIEKAISGEAEVFVVLIGSGAPKFVIKFGDGSVDDVLTMGAYDAQAGGAELAKLIGQRVIDSLDGYGSFVGIVKANEYLSRLK